MSRRHLLGSPLAYAIRDVPAVTGMARTRVFQAIKNKELTARKAGRATIIEADELRRWIKSLAKGGGVGQALQDFPHPPR